MIEIGTLIEILAVILGLASVYLTVKQNIWCWPTGLAMVALYVYIFYNVKLYSDMVENIIYIGMQIYGWYFWVYGPKKKDVVPVRRLRTKGIIFWGLIIIIGSFGLGYFMSNFTDASYPYADAITTVMSLVAQWFLGRKILESWVLWISVDVISTTIYLLKGLYFTTGLYAIFLILAIRGFIEWNESRKKVLA